MKGVTDGGETEQTGPSMMGLAQKSATVEKGHQSSDKPSGTQPEPGGGITEDRQAG